MLNSTVELITLWASSSPSLLAFCFSHVIVAVILLGGRGEWASGVAGAETLTGIQVQEGKRSDRGRESPTAAAGAVDDVENRDRHSRHSFAPDSNGRAKGAAAEVDADAVQVQANEKCSGAEEGPAAVDDTVQVQENRRDDEEEDELMIRAEEFIRRMNRAWLTENVRFC